MSSHPLVLEEIAVKLLRPLKEMVFHVLLGGAVQTERVVAVLGDLAVVEDALDGARGDLARG